MVSGGCDDSVLGVVGSGGASPVVDTRLGPAFVQVAGAVRGGGPSTALMHVTCRACARCHFACLHRTARTVGIRAKQKLRSAKQKLW